MNKYLVFDIDSVRIIIFYISYYKEKFYLLVLHDWTSLGSETRTLLSM